MDPNAPAPSTPPAAPEQPAPPAAPEQPAAPAPAPAPTVDPGFQAPAAPMAPAPQPVPGAVNPGKGLGIASLILGLLPFTGLIGLILGLIGKSKSKKAGMPNTLAVVGIILSALNLIGAIAVTLLIVLGAASAVQKCKELGPGTHIDGSTTITCGSDGSSINSSSSVDFSTN